MTVISLDQFRAILRAERETATYAELAVRYGVNQYYLHQIVSDDEYTPSAKVAALLGLTVLRPAPACPECGELHIVGRCTRGKRVIVAGPRVYHRLIDIPRRALRQMLDERREF